MNWRIIRTLTIKDCKLFFRDKFFGIMTIAGVFLYIAFYFIMPATLNEKIEIGLYAPHNSQLLGKNIKAGLILQQKETEEELKEAVKKNELPVGISIPGDIRKSKQNGENPQLIIYYSSEIPEELKEIYTIFMSEIINHLFGNKINIEPIPIVLGPDMGGKQIPYRVRMLPLFLFMLIITETFGLANLITSELESGTMEALLTTPMSIFELFAGKGITGVLLTFVPSLLLMVVTGNLGQNSFLIIITLLLGSLLVTGLAFFIASISRDMMSVIAWGVLFMIVLVLPALSLLFPGTVTGWIQLIPSFHFIKILHSAMNFNIGWTGNLFNFLCLGAYNIIFILLGIITLKRKVT
jgi:ABC-2 type transport system permease protein